jgi:hypothetical protein
MIPNDVLLLRFNVPEYQYMSFSFQQTRKIDKMTATTYSNFNEKTESLKVAEKFADQIHGKTILVTGVNRGGIGFSTAKSFVIIIHTLYLNIS